MENDRLAEKLDHLNVSMTSILVEQAKLSTAMETLTENVKDTTASAEKRNVIIDDHSVRLTKIESSMKILAWLSVILSGVVTWRIIQILSGT
jgi:hypothetical protein